MASRTYTDGAFRAAVEASISIAGLLSAIGLRPCGANYAHARKTIQRLGVDATHFRGQAWNRDQQLKDWSGYSRASRLKGHLVRDRGHRCEACQRNRWEQLPIALEVHHQDGDRTNNAADNLRLLCPNCHAQTPNWRNRAPV